MCDAMRQWPKYVNEDLTRASWQSDPERAEWLQRKEAIRKDIELFKPLIYHIDAAIGRMTTHQPCYVYRGITVPLRKLDGAERYKLGRRVCWEAISSTTFEIEVLCTAPVHSGGIPEVFVYA